MSRPRSVTRALFVVDTGTAPMADRLLAEIKRLAGDKPIRFILNTHAHADHVGGNVDVAKAGRSIIAGNFVGQAGPGAANAAKILSARKHAPADEWREGP